MPALKAEAEEDADATNRHARLDAGLVLIPLAVLVLAFPQQSLRLVGRVATAVRAFALGLELKHDVERFVALSRRR